jgi:hypothetical protein
MNPRYQYLIQEFRAGARRAMLEAEDLKAIGLALSAGLINAEQALELAADCDALRYVLPTAPPAEGSA